MTPERIALCADGLRLSFAANLRVKRGPDGSTWLELLDSPGGSW